MSISSSSTNTNLKGKRKKKIPCNANPLFTQWLTEWKQEAAEKGWKSAHTYAKALKTLKLFPLSLASGKDCMLLQNFGDKICKMLDEKLIEYKRNQGILNTDSYDSSDSCGRLDKDSESLPSNLDIRNDKNISRERKSADKSRDKNTASSSASGHSGRSLVAGSNLESVSSLYTRLSTVNGINELSCQTGCSAAASVNCAKKSKTSGLHNISGSDDSDTEAVSPPQKKKARATGNHGREYVPAYRSGPYALILTLYRYMQDTEFKGYLTKSELTHAAQPFSDKSFIVPDAGSRYTAWSSMGTLIKNGFILKTKSPARYTLTETGYQLGERLMAAEMQGNNTSDISHPGSSGVDSSHLASFCKKEHLQGRSTKNRASEVFDAPRSKTSELVSHLQQQNTRSDDDDLGRAITESLLSYSQEESRRLSLSSAPLVPSSRFGDTCHRTELNGVAATKSDQIRIVNGSHETFSSTSSSIINANDEGILIVSDDDDCAADCVFQPRTWAHYHSMSPSQSSPPKTRLLKSPSPKSSLSSEAVSQTSALSIKITDIDQQQKETNSATKKSPQFGQFSATAGQKDIMEISDSSSGESGNVLLKEHGDRTNKNSYESDDDDDELPDLVLPLSKRLEQRGHAESGLLKRLASSFAPQSSALQNTVTKTNKEDIYQQDQLQRGLHNFVNLKSKPVSSSDHVTSTYSAAVSISVASNTSDQCHIFNSSDSGHSSYISTVHNTEDCFSIDTVDVPHKDIRLAKTIHDSCENLRHFQSATAVSASSSPTASVVEHCPVFTFQPGSFDIILCLDNREFYGCKGSSKTLLPELMKNGILCDLRLLHVGDLLWIARERVEHQTDRRGRELVLHYIIERKRMDDLVSSMTDGRLKEQKFRLKHCGLSEPIILIEEYGSIQNFSISEDRIKQSIVNSQIIDGFKVKRCGSAKDAVTYLATMTHFLTQHYSSKTLHAVSLDQLKLLKGQQSLQKKEHFLIPFDVFNEASVKHKDLTVKEMFAKQLIQIPGVSAERARAITHVYPSFSILMGAYERCADDKERQKLLSGIKCGKKERNLGISLSQLLCMLYTQTGSLS